jgi:Mannosyl-glycoprotein endo-beta-N-acetylglucosaminidase/LysM domain
MEWDGSPDARQYQLMKIKLITLWVVMVAGQRLQAQYSVDVINYVNTYKALAMTEMQRSGIPAAIILAQGIHESQAGTSELVLRSNNHFGIKCKDDWKGPAVYHDDDSRQECFRSYSKPEDSYRDHSDFLRGSSRYADLFKYSPDDYEDWAYGLKKAGYATNIHYPQILIKLIQVYNLQQYTLIAMGRMRPEEEVVLHMPGSPAGGGVASAMNPGNGIATDPGGGAAAAPGGADSPVAVQYPEGEFTINNTRVIFAKAGISLLSIANQYELPLGRLLEFNDLKGEDVLVKDQLLFLQRKRRTGASSFHIVRQGETLYDICQSEGLRYEDLIRMNQGMNGTAAVNGGQLANGGQVMNGQPAAGEKIWLRPKGTTN